ncbi:MAG: hypothetical protein JWP94_1601 [Mucilaginibacter sp.]|nr:hypothetical protein [Mucilaginibacter sp.]
MKAEPVIVERTFNAPVQKVWEAITDNAKMKQWYFDLEEFRPEVGFEFRFYGGTEENKYLHVCKITEVTPLKKLTHSWRYDGHPGNSFVTYELFPEGDKTKLRLTHTGLETFPSLPDFARTNFEMGWNHIIGKSLPEYLEKA